MATFILPVFLIVLSYGLGSISFSYIVSRKIAGIDIREHGSKNAGATNTLRVLGVGPAVLVLVLDALKGSLAVLLSLYLTHDPVWPVLAGLAAIVGHNWPVFFGFKGGKGVATTIGVVAVLTFLPGLLAGIVAILAIVIFRYVSLGSLIFVTLLPLMIVLLDRLTALSYPTVYVIGVFVIMILSYIRHRSNIVRLIRGEENKIGGTA
ncbi:glycerol-3-phosphate 1-O-acyltransferase PlsY [Caldalkalibacillus thermarum TA2.A1]|uniref:Glycerol-3-phosphate acyltransferase n=1 Tax=Caldalkalibacillus thermarum (strain TA2.A1) TaxID=986075 RepID=A0A8X8L6A6_CALTT|nr:glycerol-3-phosphate 1-O-acyltransferase PlsY [Caldalkalibacillus thermarum]QZT32632.1 glycerol-3-phosphate 1-O-acyltransferase PlsY [Caldalkalibacillus thermarum TA2.A1]